MLTTLILRRGVLGTAVLLLAACGGGGGGGGGFPLSLQLLPADVAVTVLQGQTETFTTTGTVSGEVDGVVNVLIEDPVGVIDPAVQIDQISNDGYQATFTTADNLAADSYRGNIAIRLCGGSLPNCNPEYGRANLAYTITVQAVPVPVASTIAPTQSTAGTNGFTLTVNGTNFLPFSIVNWDGLALATTYVSPTQLQATVTATELVDGGSRAVTVVTPAPGGGTSGSITHTVIAPVPVLGLVSPAATTAGCGSFTLTAAGQGFVPSSVVRWDGNPLVTRFVTSTALRATVPGSLLASPGSGSVAVVSPPAGGGVSAARPVAISSSSPPSSRAVTLQLDPAHTGVANTRCPDTPGEAPLWSVAVGGTPSYPLIADGRVFVTVSNPPASNQTTLLALDAATGAVLWGPVPVAGDDGFFGRANAAYDNDAVFVAANWDPALPVTPGIGARPGSVQAYSAATGALLWRTGIEQNGSSMDVVGPVAANGLVYVTVRTTGGTLQGFDQATGARTIFVNAGSELARWPAVTPDAVILATPCNTEAFDAANGSTLWLQNAGCSTGSVGVPVIADGLVYSTTGGFGSANVVYALAGGSPAGTYDRGGIPAIRGGVGFDSLSVGRIRATELATGTTLWEWPGVLESPVFGSQDTGPLVVNDVVITGNAFGGIIHGVDAATGTFLWTLDVGDGEGFPSPAFAELAVGENLLVLSRGRRVKAFRVGTGP